MMITPALLELYYARTPSVPLGTARAIASAEQGGVIWKTCGRCAGTAKTEDGKRGCERCKGKGSIVQWYDATNKLLREGAPVVGERTCLYCTGATMNRCRRCKGRGHISGITVQTSDTGVFAQSDDETDEDLWLSLGVHLSGLSENTQQTLAAWFEPRAVEWRDGMSERNIQRWAPLLPLTESGPKAREATDDERSQLLKQAVAEAKARLKDAFDEAEITEQEA